VSPLGLSIAVALLVGGAALAVVLARRALSAGGKGPWALAVFELAVALWSVAYAIEINVSSLPAKLLLENVQYLGIVLVSPAWLLFAIIHGGGSRWVNRKMVIALAVEPIFVVVLAWTALGDSLLRIAPHVVVDGAASYVAWQRGPVFVAHTVYSYALILAGVVAQLTWLVGRSSVARRQSAILIASALTTVVANLIYLVGLSPFGRLDLTIFGMHATGMVLSFGILKLQLLDVWPIARGLVLDSMDEAVIFCDERDRVIQANPAARQLLGERFDRPLPLVRELFAEFPAVLDAWPTDPGGRSEGSCRLERDGSPVDLEFTIAPLNASALTRPGRVLVFRDRSRLARAESDRRTSEQLLRSVTDNSPDFISLLDLDARILFINRIYPEFRMEDVIGSSLWEYFPPGEDALVERTFEETLSAGAPRECEAIYERPGANRIVFECRFAPVIKDGVAVAVVLNARDISAKREAQLELERSQRLAALGQMVGTVAHEVRNPLFGLAGTLEALEARLGNDRPDLKEHVRVMLHELNRLTDLMNDLLEFGRPETLEITRLPLTSLTEGAVQDCRKIAAERGVEVRVVAGEWEQEIEVDERGVRSVIQNLLDNAIRHSKPGGRVEIALSIEDHSVELSVRDSGPGFDAVDLERAFEPFYTTRQDGTGLGLAICHKIVSLHGGRIRIGNAEDGGGAKVRVSLPRERPPDARSDSTITA